MKQLLRPLSFLLLTLAGASLHAQTLISRLIAKTDYAYTGTTNAPTDSLAYYYTGSMGGDPGHTIRYTTDSLWNYVGSVYNQFETGSQTFDTNKNILTTTYQYYISGAWVDSIMLTYAYDANNNITEMLVQQWDNGTSAWDNYKKTDFTYDANNNPLTINYSSWNTATAAWVAGKWYTNTYNLSNQLVASYGVMWDVPTSSFLNYSHDTFTYDGSGNRISDLTQSWIASSWKNSALDVRTYDALGAVLTDTSYSGSATTGAWTYDNVLIDSNDANGNQLISVSAFWSVPATHFVNSKRYVSTYNSYNQLTSYQTFSWTNLGMWIFSISDKLTYYYYETYDISGIQKLNNSEVKLNVFPNPAADYVNIQMKQANAQPFDVMVYDGNGRIISRQHENATTAYNKLLPVSYLPAGNYMVVINSATGSTTKQFVVTH